MLLEIPEGGRQALTEMRSIFGAFFGIPVLLQLGLHSGSFS